MSGYLNHICKHSHQSDCILPVCPGNHLTCYQQMSEFDSSVSIFESMGIFIINELGPSSNSDFFTLTHSISPNNTIIRFSQAVDLKELTVCVEFYPEASQ